MSGVCESKYCPNDNKRLFDVFTTTYPLIYTRNDNRDYMALGDIITMTARQLLNVYFFIKCFKLSSALIFIQEIEIDKIHKSKSSLVSSLILRVYILPNTKQMEKPHSGEASLGPSPECWAPDRAR